MTDVLHLLFGRAGSGKTQALLETVRAMVAGTSGEANTGVGDPSGPNILILTPETVSHALERRLASVSGARSAAFCEVVTFRRLESRIFARLGGGAVAVPDDAARLLLMYEAFTAVQTRLQVYRSLSRSCELLQGLLTIWEECAACCITPEKLLETAAACGDTVLGQKLTDLALLFTAYTGRIQARMEDPRDGLERADALLQAHPEAFRGVHLCIDGFEGFTPREKQLLETLLGRCGSVCAAFTGEPDADEDSVFAKSVSTARWLERAARDAGHTVRQQLLPVPVRPSELSYLEARFEDYGAGSYAAPASRIHLYRALSAYGEAEWIAARIRRALREDASLRLRDFAIALPEFSAQSPAIEAALGRYGLPCQSTQRTDLLQQSVVAVTLAALDAVIDDYDTEDVFQYIKTGLSGIAPRQWDALENYCLLWNLSRFPVQPFSSHPAGLKQPWDENSRAALNRLNEARAVVMEPLTALAQGLSGSTDCETKARAFYAFWERIGLPQACEAREKAARDAGNLQEAEECRQIWEILCRALDSFVSVLGDKPLGAQQFAALWRLTLSQYTVGVIPAALDRVRITPLEGVGSARWVFIAGCTESALPGGSRGRGLLTDDDRERLEDLGLPLQTTPRIRGLAVRFGLYSAMSAASEQLFCTLPLSENGRESLPLTRLRLLFPQMECMDEAVLGSDYRLEAPGPALEYALTGNTPASRAARAYFAALPTTAAPVAAAEAAASLRRGPVAPALMLALQGDTPRISATTAEMYNECRYRFFAQRTLQLQPRRPAAFDALESGNYFHEVLERTVREVQETFGSWEEAGSETVLAIGERHSRTYFEELLGDLEQLSARQRHLLQRVQRELQLVLTDLYAEFSVSRFRPMDFELRFAPGAEMQGVPIPLGGGVTAMLTGKADRVDGWLHQGALYLRVVDYKSSRKEFRPAELLAGTQLQLPLYLLALEEQFDRYLGQHAELPQDAAMRPAGLLYKSLKEPIVRCDEPLEEAELEKEREKMQKASGLVLNDPVLLDAMDTRYIPVTLKKDGTPDARSQVAGLDQFRNLHRYVRKLLQETGRAMFSGANEANPHSRGGGSACDFCSYQAVCQFDRRREPLRDFRNVSRDRFFEMIAQEETPDAVE